MIAKGIYQGRGTVFPIKERHLQKLKIKGNCQTFNAKRFIPTETDQGIKEGKSA